MRFRRFRRRSSHKPSGTVKVQGVLDAVIRERGWFGKFQERSVFDVWDSIAGEGMAQHCHPISISRGVLRVEVSHPVYAQELSMMKDFLMNKLKTQLKSQYLRRRKTSVNNRIIDIQFHFNPNFQKEKSGDSVISSDTRTTEKNNKSVSPEKEGLIEDTVSVIEDADLRCSLKALFLAQSSHRETTD